MFFSSVIKGKVYLFGGSSSPEATECLPGVHRFDIGKSVKVSNAVIWTLSNNCQSVLPLLCLYL